VVLLDLTLPDGGGVNHSTPYINSPQKFLIVLTGFGDTDLALETLNLAPKDYIVKMAAISTARKKR